jgi:hypothetical protein
MVAPPRSSVAFDADDPVALYMDGGVFEQLQRVAKLMAASALVPEHLRGKVADCSLVAAQAFRWRTDPFAVAQHTFVLKGKLGYEGKLIAAVVNSHKSTERRLSYTYSGDGKTRSVVVSGRIRGEDKDRTVEGNVDRWATDNEQWRKDPDQMLAYRGARQWARRHMPEAMIGIQAEEEVREAVDLELAESGAFEAPKTLADLTAKLAPRPAVPEAEKKPGGCSHPDVPPSKLAALAPGKSLVCPACAEELKAEERQPGEDEGPATAVETSSAPRHASRPCQGRLQE